MSNRLGVPTAQFGGYLYRRRAGRAHGTDDVVIVAGEGAVWARTPGPGWFGGESGGHGAASSPTAGAGGVGGLSNRK